MPRPYDYSLNIPNPIDALMQGVMAAQQQEQAQQKQQQAIAKQRAYASLGPNATFDDYQRVIQRFPEDSKMLLEQWKGVDEAKRTSLSDAGGKVFAWLQPDAEGNIDPTKGLEYLDRYARAYREGGDEETARQFDDIAAYIRQNPAAGRTVLGTVLSTTDPERFKSIAGDRTAFQQDFQFIKNTFGPDAAAEFAQYGRGGIVTLPLGNGQTYVGPASMAPGASRWQEQGGGQPQSLTPETAAPILERASEGKTITQAEADVVKQSLGPRGKAAFDKWRAENGIRVIVRTGTKDGRRVVQFDDGTVDYAD